MTVTLAAHKPEYIHNRASTVAAAATVEYLQAHPGEWFPCGFAWVTIRPARGPMVAWMKANGIGSKAYGGGWQLWNPSGCHTQSMEALKAGAKAYVAEAIRLGLTGIDYDCRMD